MGESKGFVQADRGGVRLVHVQHDLRQSTTAEVAKSDQGERASKAAATLGRIYPDDVHLAEGFMTMPGLGSQPVVAAVNLGPVEADQSAVPLGEEEAVRVKPSLSFAHVQVGPGPGALLGVPLECPVIDGDPGIFVLSRRGMSGS